MSVWNDGVESHATYQALTAAEATIDGISGTDDPDQIALLARARAAVSSVRAALLTIDPQLVADETLNRISPEANQIRDSAAAFSESRDAAHLSSLESNVSTVLDEVGLGAFFSPAVVDALRDSLRRYRVEGRKFVSDLDSDAAEVRAGLIRIKNRVDGLDQTIQERTDVAAAAITANLVPTEAKLADLSVLVTAETTRVQDLVAKQQVVLDEWQANHTRELLSVRSKVRNDAAKQREGLQQSAGEQLSEITRAGNARLDEIYTQGNALVVDLQRLEEQARDRVTTIGALAVAGGFGEYAVAEKTQADRWSWAAVITLAVAVLPGLLYFISTLGSTAPVDLARFAERVAIGVPFYAISAYCGLQSRTHRVSENYGRRMALELPAILPYLASIPDTDRQRMILQLAPEYFGLRERRAARPARISEDAPDDTETPPASMSV